MKFPSFVFSPRDLATICLALFCAAIPRSAHAVAYTWNGGGATPNWTDTNNWGTALTTSSTLVFTGNTQTTNNNNTTAGGTYGLVFSSTSGSLGNFTLSGSNIALSTVSISSESGLQTINFDMSLASARTINVTSGTVVLNGSLSGVGGITKGGANSTLILNGSNSYSGTTTTGGNGGSILVLGNDNAMGTGILSINSTSAEIQAGNGDRTFANAVNATTIATFSGTNGITFTSTYAVTTTNNRSLTNNITNGKTLTLSGPVILPTVGGTNWSITGAGTTLISGTIGMAAGVTSNTLTQAGTGTTTFSAANTYSGSTIFSDGVLVAANDSAFSDSTLVFTGGTLGASGAPTRTLSNTINVGAGGGGFTGSSNLTLSGSFIYTDSSNRTMANNLDSGKLLTISGPVALSNTAAITLTIGGGSANTLITGVVSSSTSSRLAYAGTGTLTLANDNTYTGITTVSSGVLQIGNGGTTGSIAGTLTDNSAVIFNRTGSLAYNLAISGSGSVTKTGSGTLSLGATNTFTGGLTVDQGTVLLTSTRGQGATTNTITVNSSGVFDQGGLGITTGTLALNGGSVINGSSIGPSAIDARSGSLSVQLATASGQLVKSTSGTVTLSGSSPNWASSGTTGGIIINDGVLINNNLRALGSALMGTISGTGVVVNSPGTLNMAVSGTTGLLQINGGSVTGPGSLGVAVLIGAQGGLVSAGLTGTSTLTKTTSGTLVLSGSNSYSGGTVINGGVVQVGGGSATGSIAGNVSTGTSSAVLAFNRSNAYTYSGTISGSGQVKQIGSGTTTLTGIHSFTGTTSVSAGTLLLSAVSNNIANSAAIDIASGAKLDVTGVTGGFTLAGGQTLKGTGTVIGSFATGSGSILSAGNSPGTLNVSGNLTLGNSTNMTFDLGDLIAVSGSLTLGNSLSLTATSDLAAGNYDLFTYTGSLLNVGDLGTWTATGLTNTYSFLSDGDSVYLNVVPEPQTYLLAGLGLGVLLWRARVRKSSIIS